MAKKQTNYPWQAAVQGGTGRIALMGYLIVGVFCGGFGVWATTAQLDEAAVAPGVIAAAGQNITIQHLEGGVVRAVNAREGDRVRRGDTLVEIDPTAAAAQLNRLVRQYVALVAKAARLEVERDGGIEVVQPAELANYGAAGLEAVMAAQRKEFAARLARFNTERAILQQRVASIEESVVGLRAQKDSLDRQFAIVEEETALKRALLEKGLTNRSEYSELLRAGASLVGQAGQIEAQIASSKTQLAEAAQQIERLGTSRVEQSVAELNATRVQIADVEEQIFAARAVLDRTIVRAPADGIVVRSIYNFANSVVRPGEPLMEILPTSSELIVDARVRPEDVDKIKVGQRARMHFRALNSRTTPEVTGEIFYVSADRLFDQRSDMPYYAVRLKIADELPQEISPEQVLPGLPVDSFISTGERTLSEYLVRPIFDSFSRAFKEE